MNMVKTLKYNLQISKLCGVIYLQFKIGLVTSPKEGDWLETLIYQPVKPLSENRHQLYWKAQFLWVSLLIGMRFQNILLVAFE